jgi:hypothetical protein
MTAAYQLLSLIALYSDIANTFEVFDDGIAAGRMVRSGRSRFIAAHPLEG